MATLKKRADQSWSLREIPESYLQVRECRSGDEWIRPIPPRAKLNLARLVKAWIKDEWAGEAHLDGKMMPGLEGDFYATIKTDRRPPDSCIVWASGGFYIKSI